MAGIIGQGANYNAVDAFNGQYKLAELRRAAESELAGFDFMLVPTTPTMPRRFCSVAYLIGSREACPLRRGTGTGSAAASARFAVVLARISVLPRSLSW